MSNAEDCPGPGSTGISAVRCDPIVLPYFIFFFFTDRMKCDHANGKAFRGRASRKAIRGNSIHSRSFIRKHAIHPRSVRLINRPSSTAAPENRGFPGSIARESPPCGGLNHSGRGRFPAPFPIGLAIPSTRFRFGNRKLRKYKK